MYKPETIKLLSEINVRRYTNRINSGSKMVRIGECQTYLGFWNSIVAKEFLWDRLSAAERQEVQEAAMDEEIESDLAKPATEA
jgi:hypothetical protein